jgi:hypothetical protein
MFLSITVISTSEVRAFHLFSFHQIFNFWKKFVTQKSLMLMASTKRRASCRNRFWKLLLHHLSAHTLSVIIITHGKLKIVEQIQMYSYMVHRYKMYV